MPRIDTVKPIRDCCFELGVKVIRANDDEVIESVNSNRLVNYGPITLCSKKRLPILVNNW